MKQLFVIVFLLLPSFNSQTRLVPFGMTQVYDNFFVDDDEVTVGEWLSFYYYAEGLDSLGPKQSLLPKFEGTVAKSYQYLFDATKEEYLMVETRYGLADQVIELPIPKKSYDEAKRKKLYLKAIGNLMDYPITNITYEQAVSYCEWKTKFETDLLVASGFDKITYTLPTHEQFLKYSNNPFEKFIEFKEGKRAVVNCKDCRQEGDDERIGKQLQYTEMYYVSFPKDGKSAFDSKVVTGLYNLQGNASEMILEKGKAMGGSYLHDYQTTISAKPQTYTESAPWLGFRCVAYYNEPNKNY